MKNLNSLFSIFFLSAILFSCKPETPEIVDPPLKEFKFWSAAFLNDSMIPAKYTCDGNNISPELKWENAPGPTQSFALIMEDPDAPTDTFVHWILYDMPATQTQIAEKIIDGDQANGAKHGKSSFMVAGYRGPCPPSGTHRYFFTLYALDKMLNIPPGKTKAELKQEMSGHIIKQLQLVGKYQR